MDTQPLEHRIFFGRFGLRAAYGMAIFAIVWYVLRIIGSICAVASIEILWPPIAAGFLPALVAVSDIVIFFGMLAFAWLLSKAERRRLSWFGIGTNRLRDFIPGAFWGFAALSTLVVTLRAFHLLYFDGRILYGIPMLLYGLKWFIAFLFVGFAEEYFLRGYMQYTLTRGVFGIGEKISPAHARSVSFWIAAILLSIAFACLHLGNNGENFIGILLVFIVGIVFAYALFRTGSLWWAIGFHMAWDWAQSFLYGVPDSGNISVGRLFQTHFAGNSLLSGGSDGPEGSLICIPILVLMLLVIRFTTKPGQQPPLEQLSYEDVSVAGTYSSRS